ncbi:MAG: hypothetical protein P4M09_03055 [Devosia sp.]|nr:hypothetical protein [Devosia sp.]
MSALATLTDRLTLPYKRGAEFASIPLGADDAAGTTAFAAHDFAEYRARWGENPASVTYVIAPLQDVNGDDLLLTLDYKWGGADAIATMLVPRGTRAGTGLVMPLPANADAGLKLVSLAVVPKPDGAGQDAWEVMALLGTIARLVWLLGAEKDGIARTGQDVRNSRFVKTAFAAGLDALGQDLRVARFPPRPYSLDADTVALWHLDELPPTTTIADEITQFDGAGNVVVAGNPGIIAGAIAGVPGRYGTGFGFAAAGDGTSIAVPASADFDIAAGSDATIEAFVSAPAGDATPRVVVARRAAETAAGAANMPGWSLSLVKARGFDANILFALCDGTREIRLFADVSIADGGFHHVAGILDRGRGQARLFVDGVQRTTAPVAGLGAIAPPDDIRFGSTAAGNALGGTIDEVRISRVARRTFHPALGEDDDAYRARLRLFRRWVLPTAANMIAMVNEAAPLPADPAPYELIETNQLTQTVELPLRIVPTSLAAGLAIAADGTAPKDENVAGLPDDAGFDPALDLVSYSNGAVDSVADPGHGRMQAGAARRLDALVKAAGGAFVLEHSFDPVGPSPLHAVGRALRLRHQTMPTAALGALAHRMGFAYVRNLGTDLAVAVEPGERLAIVSAPAVDNRIDAGQALDVTVTPVLPASGSFSWTIVTPGPARAQLVAHSDDPATLQTPITTRPRVRLVTDTPGDLAVRVEFSIGGRTRSGTLTLRVDPTSLSDGQSVDAVGNASPDALAITGAPDAGFDAAYLVTHAAEAAIDFGADPDNAKMQVATCRALDALVALLAAQGVAGKLKVTQAYVPAGTGVEKVGRRLVLGHETLDPGRLGALAARIFDLVSRAGSDISVFVRADNWIALGDATTGAAVPSTVDLDVPLALRLLPAGAPDGAYSWTTRTIGVGAGSFDTTLEAKAKFTPNAAGAILLVATYVAPDASRAPPYSFEIRLKPALDVPATIIPKPQYDIIMNVLNAFHPIGVEVRTANLRGHVREISQNTAAAFPAYSFPNFRF